MKLLVKVYEHQFIRKVITQEVIYSEVTIEQDLRDFGIAKFTMPLVKIEEDNMVEIYEIENTDILVFRGFVRKIKPIWRQFGIIEVECRSEKALMMKRKALKTKATYNVTSITSLPQFPNPVDIYANYRLNNSLTGLFLYEGIEVPNGGDGPPPPPYYKRGFIPFTDTVFLIEGGIVKRVENGTIYNEGAGTAVTLKSIIDDLIGDYAGYEQWSYEANFDQAINLNIKQGDTYFDVFDELAEQTGSIRDVRDSKIIFNQGGFTDRTQGQEYQEIIYNATLPNGGNISSIDVEGTATRSNIVIGSDQNNNKIIESDFIDRIYGVDIEEYRDGDLRSKVEKYLTDHNKNQRIYQVEVEANTLIADVGDKVKLIVENTNSYFDINSDVMILSKTVRYNQGSKNASYTVGELSLSVSNANNFLYGIQKDIKLLKLK